MIFGKIEYLNLLPFHLFLKRHLRQSVEKMPWRKRGSVPSAINRAFKARRIDAAVISSVRSRGCRCTDFGIVADGKVQSVLLVPGEVAEDGESDTSNLLAQVLGLKGKIVIGDKALRFYLQNPDLSLDLATEWKKRENLPFVFARLCAHPRHFRRIERLSKRFFRHPTKIPYHQLRQEAARRNIEVEALRQYLQQIHYHIRWREKRALKRFFYLVKKLKK